LVPTIEGERRSCFAITEPGAGSDAKNIKTTARKDGGDWVINGEKTFITGGNEADFAMVFAVTNREKGADGGVTCFLVDRDMRWSGQGRWVIPARGVGAAERLLGMALAYAKTRVTFGEPIADRQAIQWMIADSQVEIEAAKWLTLHAAWRAENESDARHAASI